jgi:glycosyltransferase involved in cell wall biosynthesis
MRDSMKVLIITRTLAEFANQQGKIREISKLGVNLTVVSPARWAGRKSELQRVKPDGYEFLACRCWFSGTSSVRLGNHLHFYPGISSIIAREKWDFVHIDEEPFNLATYHALRGCRRHRARAVFTTWQNLMKRYPPPFNLFERYVFENTVGAIAGSRGSLDLLRRREFRGLAAHIPQLGVDPNMFRKQDASGLRRKLGVGDTFVIGFVGRFSPEKGLDTLIKALALLPGGCTLVLVGNGPDRPRLNAVAQTTGVSARVKWVPWVDSGEVVEYLNAFDVLALPSRTRWAVKEQFGRVLVEAMSCETCVVGSDSGEIPNVVGDAGLIFHEGDERELAGCLRQLLNDSSLRESFRHRGRQRVLENFTYAKIAAETVGFYRRICSGCDEATDVMNEWLGERQGVNERGHDPAPSPIGLRNTASRSSVCQASLPACRTA